MESCKKKNKLHSSLLLKHALLGLLTHLGRHEEVEHIPVVGNKWLISTTVVYCNFLKWGEKQNKQRTFLKSVVNWPAADIFLLGNLGKVDFAYMWSFLICYCLFRSASQTLQLIFLMLLGAFFCCWRCFCTHCGAVSQVSWPAWGNWVSSDGGNWPVPLTLLMTNDGPRSQLAETEPSWLAVAAGCCGKTLGCNWESASATQPVLSACSCGTYGYMCAS